MPQQTESGNNAYRIFGSGAAAGVLKESASKIRGIGLTSDVTMLDGAGS